MLVRFKISGNLRFLSHAELMKLFERACARAAFRLRFSQGFNPRPKISLPLPKSVAVACENELLLLRLEADKGVFDPLDMKCRLAQNLPRDCELLAVEPTEYASIQPTQATYFFEVFGDKVNDNLNSLVKKLMMSEHIVFGRMDKRGYSRDVDVRPFIESIDIVDKTIAVRCVISASGTIRVNEITSLLGLTAEDLTSPIRRADIQWRMN